MKRQIIALILTFVICFTFIVPPKKSDAFVGLLPMIPMFLTVAKVAGLTAVTAGGAYVLYNSWYNSLSVDNKTAVDLVNNGSVLKLGLNILTSIYDFAGAKSDGSVMDNQLQEKVVEGLQGNFEVVYTMDSTQAQNYSTSLYQIDTYKPFSSVTYNATSNYSYIQTATANRHYYAFGPMKYKFSISSTYYIQSYYKFINSSGIESDWTIGRSQSCSLAWLIDNGYITYTNVAVKDSTIAVPATSPLWDKYKDDSNPEDIRYEVPGGLPTGWLEGGETSTTPADTQYTDRSTVDVLNDGWIAEDTGSVSLDLTGTNTLLDGIKTLVNTIATGVGALTDFVVPDVTLDFSGFQNLGSLMIQKFPFSLPWDLKNLITTFNADPEPIKFENLVIYKNPYNDVWYEIDFDLTEWEWLAAITRYFILAAFSLGLIFRTRDLIRS